MANNVVNVTSLNFDALKASLKAHLQSQSDFTDYDYEASTMATIIDLLAYNTYQNAFYLNMIGNEMYLDSAQIRENVVSRAKMLGYTPRSAKGASAILDIVITPPTSPSSIIIPKNTTFTSDIDGVTYKFVTPSAYTITPSEGVYSGSITITEGEPLTHRFTVNTSSPVLYVLPNDFVDTDSLAVQVQTSVSNTSITTFTKANDLTQVYGNSNVYFLQETFDQEYQVEFGDGIIGAPLVNGNIVSISYRVCHGSLCNGANNFVSPSTLATFSNFTSTLNTAAAGGANAETVASIKWAAPRNFETQNRAVVADDYKRILLRETGDLQAVSVWGGEENVPPIYGRVYIAVKPTIGTLISASRKETLTRLLERYNVMSIDPVFIDAAYIYIIPVIEVRYNDQTTNQTAEDIAAAIETAIVNYETDKLGTFSGKFRYSDFLRTMDDVEASIVSTLVEVTMQKRFIPITDTATTYSLSFNNTLEAITADAISSSSFTYAGIEGCEFDEDGLGNVRIFHVVNGGRSYVNETAGTINYRTGVIILDSLLITDFEGDEIKIDVEPEKQDLNGVRNQILLFADAEIHVYNDNTGVLEATVEEITTTGTAATTNSSGVNTVIV